LLKLQFARRRRRRIHQHANITKASVTLFIAEKNRSAVGPCLPAPENHPAKVQTRTDLFVDHSNRQTHAPGGDGDFFLAGFAGGVGVGAGFCAFAGWPETTATVSSRLPAENMRRLEHYSGLQTCGRDSPAPGSMRRKAKSVALSVALAALRNQGNYSLSILAARTKSLSVRPSILWVQDRNFRFSPAEADIRMVSFALGQRADPIDEIERFAKIAEPDNSA